MTENGMIIGAFFLAVILLSFFAFFVVINFIRYRFKGDRTLQFVGLFALMFIATVVLSTLLISLGRDPDINDQNEIEFSA